MTRQFLAVVGTAYILLAIWCAAAPDLASQAVGFTLRPGSGQSEFLVVYGGLELGLGLAFLWPLIREDETLFVLRLCVIVHGCLVLFRTIAFFAFSGFETTTFVLAGGEWLLFISSIWIWQQEVRAESDVLPAES